MRREKGITLIALIVTIIILLILAGVTISLITGDSNLLGKAKKAIEETLISEGKEKIELALIDLISAKKVKGENLIISNITEIENNEIKVIQSDNFPVDVVYKETYQYQVKEENGNFVVSYVSKVNEPTESDKPTESTDKTIQKSFIPKIENLTNNGFTIVVDADSICDDNGQNNKIIKYEYHVGNNIYESEDSNYTLTNLDNLFQTIYVTVYDNDNNSRTSKTVEIQDRIVGGTPFASSNANNAHYAFDKTSSYWDGGNINSYIGYEFEEPVECTEVKISQPYYTDIIKEFKIEYSDDGINYTNAGDGTFTFQIAQSQNIQTFKLRSNLGKHKYWRYLNLENYTNASFCAITELEFCNNPEKIAKVSLVKQMTSNTSSEGRLFTNNNENEAYLAFDKNLSSYWDGGNINSYIGYEFENPVECTEVSIKQPYSTTVIKEFKIQYSDDNINYNDASETFDFKKSTDIQTFKLNSNLGKHKYWRYLNLKNYADGPYCAISELEFYQVIKLFNY